jgi:hypothetical protein
MLHVVGNQDKIIRQSARGEDQVKIIQRDACFFEAGFNIAKASFPIGGCESLQHGVVLGIQRLQLCILGLGSGCQNSIRKSDAVCFAEFALVKPPALAI